MTALLVIGALVAASIPFGFLLGTFFRFDDGYSTGSHKPAATSEIPPVRPVGWK